MLLTDKYMDYNTARKNEEISKKQCWNDAPITYRRKKYGKIETENIKMKMRETWWLKLRICKYTENV